MENQLLQAVSEISKIITEKPPIEKKSFFKKKVIPFILALIAGILLAGFVYFTFPGHVDKIKGGLFLLSLMIYIGVGVFFLLQEAANYFESPVKTEIFIIERNIIQTEKLFNTLNKYSILELSLLKHELSVRAKSMQKGALYSLLGRKFAELGVISPILTFGLALYLENKGGFSIFLLGALLLLLTQLGRKMEESLISIEAIQGIIDLSIQQKTNRAGFL